MLSFSRLPSYFHLFLSFNGIFLIMSALDESPQDSYSLFILLPVIQGAVFEVSSLDSVIYMTAHFVYR